jgi:hypothetical protein
LAGVVPLAGGGEQWLRLRHMHRLEPIVDQAEIRARIELLKQDHRDLDAAIEALRQLPQPDMIQLQRFKKRKLRLKDEISMLEDLLIPDIIA